MKKKKEGQIHNMPSHTPDFKGYYDWECTNCGKMFHQQIDCDIPQCPECFTKLKATENHE